MIQIAEVSRRYGAVTAVDGVSIEIKRGEIVGLLGHNGAGKTTLMKMLTGYLEPSGGRIAVGGADVVQHRKEAQRRVGYLPETAPLYPEMLVQEYLALMAELRGVPADRIESAVARAAAATGLAGRMVQPIGTLSKGFRQRVGIAQAIVHAPDVLVLDEPTNGLDPVQIQSIRDLVKKLGETTTILLSTHILQEVEAVCDRVLVMIDGQLAADAPLTELLASHTLRLSLAEGATEVEAGLRGVDGVTEVREIGADDALPGHRAWAIDCASDAWPTQQIVATAQANGWTLGAIAPEQRTLEGVFRSLQAEHVRSAGGVV